MLMKYHQFIVGLLVGVALGVSFAFTLVLLTRTQFRSDNPNVAKAIPDEADYVLVAVTLGDKTNEMEQLLISNNIPTNVNGEGFGNWFSVASHSRCEAIELLVKHGHEKYVDDAMSWSR